MIWKEGGYAEVQYNYDKAGRLSEEKYFNTSGEPINGVDGYASVEYKYDEFGRIEDRICRNADGIVLDMH